MFCWETPGKAAREFRTTAAVGAINRKVKLESGQATDASAHQSHHSRQLINTNQR